MTGRVWKWTCQECTDEGRRGYCAPLRCYCGHESCTAYRSWRPNPPPPRLYAVRPLKEKP